MQVACQWCIISGVLFISVAALVAPSSMFLLRDHHHYYPNFDSPVSGQRHGVRRTSKHCMVGWNWVEKEKPTLVFACRSGEVTFGSAVCNTFGVMWKASNGLCRSISCCPLWLFTYCMLLSGTTHCPMRVYPYCTIIWLEYMAVFMTSSTRVHKLCRTSSLVLKCMCTVCVWVCVWQRGSGALQ